MNLMSRKMIPFFATSDDLADILRGVKESKAVDFVHAGMFAEPKVRISASDALSAFEEYLIVDNGVAINLRAVPQRSGEVMYAVDQIDNPHTIVLQTGGEHADRHLVAGQIGTVRSSKESDALYAILAKIIRSRFEKIKSYYVGPRAATLLDSGARLSATRKSPQTYDLAR